MTHYALVTLLAGAFGAPVPARAPVSQGDPSLIARRMGQPAPRPAASAVPPATRAPALTDMVPSTPAGLRPDTICVDGADDLPAAEITTAIAAFTGHRLNREDLQDLLTTVAGVARANGYLFARATIPAQTLDGGMLRILLDTGHVDEVRITGSDNKAVATMFTTLQGHAPKRAEVERQLMLAGDLPGVVIGQTQFIREGGRGVLIVPIRYKRMAARIWADNRGSGELGPVRAHLQVDFNGLLDDHDQLTVSELVTPAQPRELKVMSGRYSYHLDDAGTELALFGFYGRTNSGGAWRRYDSHGASGGGGVAIAKPLIRRRDASLWLSGEFAYVALDQWFADDLIRRDRITTANLSLNGYVSMAGGRLRAGVGVTRGLDLFGATQLGDRLASRPGANGRFTLLGAWTNWAGDLVGPFSARLAVTGQLVTAPLLAAQQITIGGPIFGRAYEFSERSGDKGILGSAELQAKLWSSPKGPVRWAQFYTFGDAGYVANLRNGFGTGALYSMGAGTRIDLAYTLRVEIEIALPIGADRFETGDHAPRISVSVAKPF